jgi:uncharacterized membrane protein YfcA
MDIVLIALLTLVASAVGTFTGFGTSTIMVPVLVAFLPLPQVLLLVGIVHWFGDIWKILLFRSGIRWNLILLFGVTGIAATVAGGLLVFRAPESLLARALGAFLLAYVFFILAKPRFRIPQTTLTATAGGLLHGFTAGIFGVGGAVRSAFLAAFDLPKTVYVFTSGAIGLIVDSGRILTYWSQGAALQTRLLLGLLLFVPVSFAGAKVAERIVERIPQDRFRFAVAIFLGLVALQLLLFPTASRPAQPEPPSQAWLTLSENGSIVLGCSPCEALPQIPLPCFCPFQTNVERAAPGSFTEKFLLGISGGYAGMVERAGEA